jgi:hypothetical protein
MILILLTVIGVTVAMLMSGPVMAEPLGCAIKAKVLTVDKRVIQESSAATKVLNSVYLDLEVKAPATLVYSASPERGCDEFKPGKKLQVFAIKETDFLRPEAFNDLKENSALEDEVWTTGKGRNREYSLANVKVMGFYQKVKAKN